LNNLFWYVHAALMQTGSIYQMINFSALMGKGTQIKQETD